jgi:hypothetical protein
MIYLARMLFYLLKGFARLAKTLCAAALSCSFHPLLGIGECRENRQQLRCGNAPQSSTGPREGLGKPVGLKIGEGGRAVQRRRFF